MDTELTERIMTILAKVSGKPLAEVSLDSALIDDLELDSINFIELDHEIKRSGLPQIQEDDLPRLVRVRDVVQVVSQYMGTQSLPTG